MNTRRLVFAQLGSGSVRFPTLPCHGLGDSEHGNDSLMVLDARSPKSRYQQRHELSERGSRG